MRKKDRMQIHFHSYAKLAFSTNEMPQNLENKSDAFYRRLLILDMNRVVKSGEKDLHLKEKVQAESDYAIHMAMIALKNLYEQRRLEEQKRFEEQERARAARRRNKRRSGPEIKLQIQVNKSSVQAVDEAYKKQREAEKQLRSLKYQAEQNRKIAEKEVQKLKKE